MTEVFCKKRDNQETNMVHVPGESKPIFVKGRDIPQLIDTPTKKHRESTKKKKIKNKMAKKSRRINRH